LAKSQATGIVARSFLGRLAVRRFSGQAARWIAVWLRRLGTLAMALAVLTSVGGAVLAWRLSQGPLALPWLTSRLEAAVNASGGPNKLAIGSVALAWEGFRLGVDRPLDLRAIDITVTDSAGRQSIAVPRAEVSLSLSALLLGRIEPRAIELDEPQLTLERAVDGTLGLDLGLRPQPDDDSKPAPLIGVLAELARAPTSNSVTGPDALFGQLQFVRIRGAHAVVVDRRLGVTWNVPHMQVDLTRGPQGGVNGTLELDVALGDQQTRFTGAATLAAGATQTHLRLRMTPVAPAALAHAVPAFASLAALDAPVSGEADIDLNQDLHVRHGQLTVRVGAGDAHIGEGRVPLQSAALVLAGTPDAMDLQTAQVTLSGHQGGTPTLLRAHGTLQQADGRLSATLALDADQLDLADLPRLWPEGTGGVARTWIVQNITTGTARNLHLDLGLQARADNLSVVVLDHASGTMDGSGVRVFWLRPVPPIDNAQGQLRVVDPNTLEIALTSGQQRLRGQPDSAPGLTLSNGLMRITGVIQPKQTSTIAVDVAGSLPDAIAFLRDPDLKALDQHPFDLKNPAGQATAKLTIGLPLDVPANPNAITLRVQAHVAGVHVTDVAMNRDLDRGVFDLDVTKDALKLTGQANLAGIPARIDSTMDFRSGPPSQVVQTVSLSATPEMSQLQATGVDLDGLLSGRFGLDATLTEHRNGQGVLAMKANLAEAELTVPGLEWQKAAGVAATASAQLMLDHDRLTRIAAIQLDGQGVQLQGSADCTDGKVSVLHAQRLVLGRTSAHGEVRLPTTSDGAPITATISGTSVDLADRLGHHHPTPRKAAQPGPGAPWTIDARFDRVLMAEDREFKSLILHAENDGRLIQRLKFYGQTVNLAPLTLEITPEQGGRRLIASAGDAGELLRGLDIVHTMEGGRLSVQARFNDDLADHPLSGSADIEDFRIRNAPALAKLLQAMTLYGLVEAVRGSGLGFSQLIAPFRLSGDVIELSEARAFSPSLGITVKGSVDLKAENLNLQGTIVPAYFFNSLLGNVPLVGKLFSPEQGGGLFAASYTLNGPLADPDVFINPLTALTPGFLRGLFGVF
jgi:hypothetical protein